MIKQLALTLPGGQIINPPAGLTSKFPNQTLGEFITSAFNMVLIIAGVLMFFWIIWGVFHYIFAGGDKNELGKARSRITWAIVGFLLLLISFAVSQYLQSIFTPQVRLPGGITNISVPPTVTPTPTPTPTP